MSQLLLYGDSGDQAGWSEFKELEKKYVEKLQRKHGKASINPKVSIPSPFARFELVQNAFRNVSSISDPEIRDKRLVFYSLDVAQFFFENHQGIEITIWNRNEQIKALEQSDQKGHQTLAKALKLYIDKERYGFNKIENLYILSYKHKILGCTSPTSLFMCTPNFLDVMENVSIELQGNAKLFQNQKPLHDRNEAFIIYMYRTVGSILQRFSQTYIINDEKDFPLYDLCEYLRKEFDYLPEKLKNQVRDWQTMRFDFETEYIMSQEGVSLFGQPLYQLAQEDAQKQISIESSFVIKSNKSKKHPLILSNVHGTYDGWSYSSKGKAWKYCITNANVANKDRRKLPTQDGAEIYYEDGWLCEQDFLDDIIIRLPYPLDCQKFFDGNLKSGKFHPSQKAGKIQNYYYYLPPIKKKFFEFFDSGYLQETIGRSSNLLIEERGDGSVVVSLRISVAGGYVNLVREYKDSGEDIGVMRALGAPENLYNAVGNIVECPIALTMMPFAKIEEKEKNHYSIQLMKSLSDIGGFNLRFKAYRAGNGKDDEIEMSAYSRSNNTYYYTIDNNDFDYFAITFEKETLLNNGNSLTHSHDAVLIPLLPIINLGQKGLNYSFDFGTTNSYVAVKQENVVSEIDLNGIIASTINYDFLKNEENRRIYNDDILIIESFNSFQDQEFIPNSFGTEYKFPHRTALSYSKTNFTESDELHALQHMNIPFIYGKNDYGQDSNYVETGFKWGDREKYAYVFIDEMARIAYTYAVKNSVDLSRCTFIWTYPLSMNKNAVDHYEEQWKRCYIKYFLNDKDLTPEDVDSEKQVVKMTESIAPFLKYCENNDAKASEMALSIDIGGGTSDIVIYKDSTDIKIASIRFAADCIFDAGSNRAMNNRMINAYYKLFSNELKNEDEKVVRMLKSFCSENSQVRPSEANSVLFALEDNPYLKKHVSYNEKLSKDPNFKIIFIYFYAAMIYYLVDLLKTYGYPKPERILFSGTGSKLLNIIGNISLLRDMTTQLITKFSDEAYLYKNDISIAMERKRPKQLTAEGALWDENNENSNSIAEMFQRKKKNIDKLVIQYSMIPSNQVDIPTRKLLNKDVFDEVSMSHVLSKVADFHTKLKELSSDEDFDLVEDFGCNENSLGLINKWAQYNQTDLYSKLKNVFLVRHKQKDLEANPDDVCEDSSLFFCPVIDIINDFLKKESD